MKKIQTLIIILLFLFTGTISYSLNAKETYSLTIDKITISDIEIIDNQNYSFISSDKATSYINIPGEPIIPKITKVFEFPIGTSFKEIIIDYRNPKTIKLSKQISPSQYPLVDGQEPNNQEIKSKEIYSNNYVYPKRDCDFYTTVGFNGEEHRIFLSIHCYPFKYHPKSNEILVFTESIIKIEYEISENTLTFPNEYDLLIICPQVFKNDLQEFVDHKNNHEIETYLITTEEIYSEYTNGRDQQENIKLFIKDEIEEKGIKYVLFVGGMIGQKYEWYVPVRYAESPSENAYISDLYYSDIYKYENNETVFDDWDSNENGIFAEYSLTRKDIIDANPDVFVGRLACRDDKQLQIMINKIINYESEKADPSWFNKMLLIGGDTYPNSGDPNGYEAELDTNVSAGYMDGFEFRVLWASTGTLTGQQDVEREINQGVGFIHMAGHANPSILVTHPPNEKKIKIKILHMYNLPPVNALSMLLRNKGLDKIIEKLTEPWFPKLTNGEKLPVVLVGGCHNSQFNTTLLNIITQGFEHAYGWGVFVPKCWSWWLTSNEKGGSIATIGNSGLGMGLQGFNYPNGLDGWLYPRFFFNYNQLGKEILGEAHSAAISDYVHEFDINKDGEDRQMIQQWVLLGDPSMLLGGYE